jgi:aspartyl-tRNA(Asn)/glutamyl-tRNA(Gln) amidotransferase subunit A
VTITDAAAALRSGQTSSAKLTEEALSAIARRNPELNVFITVMGESAMARATAMDREFADGRDRGPLHGIPYALKDNFCTRGVRTTCGSRQLADYVPDYDSAVTEKLDEAGAVLLGKVGLHEWAYGVTCENPHFGTIRNPLDPARIPGGSSGGSGAALAADMALLTMGTDTGGSVRTPAAYCGVVGLKPTTGRVSRYGILPLDFTLDHAGPMTRSVRDAAIALRFIAGYDRRDESSSMASVPNYEPPSGGDLKGIRIGVPENFYFDRLQDGIGEAVKRMAQAAQQLGAQVECIRLPDLEELNAVGRIILLVEASALMERYLAKREDFGPDILALFDQGRFIPGTDYVNAQRLRSILRDRFNRIWERVDCFFTPVTPCTAPLIGQRTVRLGGEDEDVRLASTRFLRGINVLGWPALAMPCGKDAEGLPIGLQIVGKPFDEARILRVGSALESI